MSAAQIQVILSSPESFAGLIGQTLSQDNATRRTAEDLYGQLKRQRPDNCVANLLQLLRASGDARIRATCAVFLRKFFQSGSKEPGWDDLNRTTKTLLKRELLAALAAEPERGVATQAADAAVALGALLLEEAEGGGKAGSRGGKGQGPGGWGELLGSLQGWLTARPGGGVSAVTQEAALQVVAGLALPLRSASAQLAPALAACLGPQAAPEVQLAALKAVAAFLEVLSKPRELRPYQAALAGGLAALQGALGAGRLEAAEQMLVVLIRTAECEAGLWQPHVRSAVPGMLGLGSRGDLPEEVRRLAAEFVLTLTDIKPQMVQSELGAGPLASQLVGCLAQFLVAGVEDEPGWGADPMAPPDMDEDETLGELHRHGLECATRAAESLDGAATLRAVVDMTAAWARDAADWRRRHAVLLYLSQVVGACKEVVGPAELSSLAGLLAEGLRDPHPRVRWAGCHAVGVLAGDLGPGLQLAAAEQGAEQAGGGAAILGALAALLAEPEGPACPQRVKAQACRALVGFLEGLDNEEEGEGEGGEGAASPEGGPSPHQLRVRALLAPWLEPLAGPLLGAVEACAAGQGGSVAGGKALVPTPLQESSIDVLCRLAVVLESAFAPLFPAAMPRVCAVLARAAPFHGPSAVAAGAVTEEEAAAIVRVQVGALECAAFMVRAAGPAAAAPHLPALSALLAQLARPDLEPCSPLLVPLLAAAEPLAGCLGAEMRGLLGPLLPLLAAWASRDVGLRLEEDSDEESEGSEGKAGADAASEDSDRDDSDVTQLSYGGRLYRCTASVLAARAAACSALEELVTKMGPALAPQVGVVADALLPRLLDYPLEEVHVIARRAVPQLLRSYLAALAPPPAPAPAPGAPPAADPATAQALLGRVWGAVTAALAPEAAADSPAAAASLLALPGGGVRPPPTCATRADMAEVLTRIVEGVEGSMLQQAWVAEAFAALRAALAASHAEAEGSEDGGDEDKSMEADGSVDLEAEGSDADEEEEESEEEADEEEEGESPAEARQRLRQQVESCVAAFRRKYGDAVAGLAAQVLAGQGAEAQRAALVAVRNGVVA